MSIAAERTPLAFERIVTEEVTAPLAELGFRHEPGSAGDKDTLVSYLRVRRSQEERVEFGRRIYGEGDMRRACDQDADETPAGSKGEKLWASRHFLYVQVLINLGHSNLLGDGSVAADDDAGEGWWHFQGEADLRRQLRSIVKLIRGAAMRAFDGALEAGTNRERVLQEGMA